MSFIWKKGEEKKKASGVDELQMKKRMGGGGRVEQ